MKNSDIDFVNLDGFKIVTTFFSLWLAVFFENEIERIFAYILILTFGILHGANDIKLLEKSNANILGSKKFFLILLYYLLFVGISIALFYYLPVLTLLLFIIFSAYHFGEQHWVSMNTSPSKIGFFFFLFYGSFILFLLFTAHADEVTAVVEKIIDMTLPISLYYTILYLSISMTFLMGTFLLWRGELKFNILKQVFYLLVIFIVFNTASLLWSFAIYFILWHSIPSLVDQITYLHGDLSSEHIKDYIKTSFPYWLISVIGLVALLIIFRNNLSTSLAFFFSFLAAITFPHVLVIGKLNFRKEERCKH